MDIGWIWDGSWVDGSGVDLGWMRGTMMMMIIVMIIMMMMPLDTVCGTASG